MGNVELLENKISYNGNDLFYKMNSNDESIDQISITFNKFLHNKTKNLKNGEIYVTFNNQEDMAKLIGLLLQEISKQKRINPNIKLKFVVILNNKEQEEKWAKELAGIIGIHSEIEYKQELIKSARIAEQEEMLKRQQELEKNNQLASGTNQIIKEDMNGQSQKYIEINDKIYDDNDTLSISEKKQELLKKWLDDPVEYERISSMTQEQLDAELTRVITTEQRTYYLESADNTKDDNKLSYMANDIAHKNDGKVNEELGIVENSANMHDKYTVVEEKKDDTFRIVTPTVKEQTISNKASSEYRTSDEYIHDTSIEETDIHTREIENIYYIDDYSKEIYNSNGEVIGTIGQEYTINENNQLIKGNEILGYIENIRDMPQEKTHSNVKKRVLENPNGYVSFMLVALGLSAILLIYILIKLF